MMTCVDADSEAEEMARRIINTTFKTTRLSSGYDQAEVDAFLDGAADTIRSGGHVGYTPRFSVTHLRPGYVQAEVDALVREIRRFNAPLD